MQRYPERNIKFIASESSGEVSGVLILPENAKWLLLLAHGAGAGMKHPFMGKLAGCLADEGIGTLRYNFPYIEKKNKRPDPAPVLMETVRSGVKAALRYADGLPLLAGGKSMGGRMTSMADSAKPLGVKAIVFYGFPLHRPGGTPSLERSEHLSKVTVPMLFLQGTRDKLADLTLLKPIVKKLKDKATLHIIEGADHSFHLLKSAGMSDEDVIKDLVKQTAEWAEKII